jgi:hypothetical protein
MSVPESQIREKLSAGLKNLVHLVRGPSFFSEQDRAVAFPRADRSSPLKRSSNDDRVGWGCLGNHRLLIWVWSELLHRRRRRRL